MGLDPAAMKTLLFQVYTAGNWHLKDYDMLNSFIQVPSMLVFSYTFFNFNQNVSITSWQ